MTPEASIIVPVYNSASIVAKTLHRVAQQNESCEIVVVDDASSDNTVEVVEQAARDLPCRLKLVRMTNNMGPGSARNSGIEVASGAWLALMDSDDCFEPGRLSVLIRQAESADMVADNLMLVDYASGIEEPMLKGGLSSQPHWIDLREFMLGNVPRRGAPRQAYGFLKPIIRRDFIVRSGVRYREGIRFSEDYMFYLDLLISGAKWKYVPESLYRYTIRRESLSETFSLTDLQALTDYQGQIVRDPKIRGNPAFKSAAEIHFQHVYSHYKRLSFIANCKRGRYLEAAADAFSSPRNFAGTLYDAYAAIRRRTA